MYNVPWQNGRVYQTPVGLLTASFLLRPNTMFHPEGEWSTRLVLPPAAAQRLRQLVMPAHDDIVHRAREMHAGLPAEQQARRPFKEHPFWQAGGSESTTDDIYFTFRLPTIDRQASLQAPSIGDLLNKPHRLLALSDQSGPAPDGASQAMPASAEPDGASLGMVVPFRKPTGEGPTRVTLWDAQGGELKNLVLEPDHWDAVVSFSVQQFWLRSFGAGITLRLEGVQLIGLHQRQVSDTPELLDPLLSVAL